MTLKESLLKKYRLWTMILAVVGIGLASYLYYEYAVQETFGVCNISSVVNCEPVTKGELALFMGIPVSIIGGTGYLMILIFTFLKKFKVAFGMAVFGILFCLRLMILEIFVHQVICLICLACMLVMIFELFFTFRQSYPDTMALPEEDN